MTPEQKAHIDSLSHYQLLCAIRFAKIGDPRFCGEHGEYWMKRCGEKKAEDPGQAVSDSKAMGW